MTDLKHSLITNEAAKELWHMAYSAHTQRQYAESKGHDKHARNWKTFGDNLRHICLEHIIWNEIENKEIAND